VGDDKRRIAKIVGAATAALMGCLSILAFGYALGSSGGYYDAQADGYAQQIGKAADDRLQRCFGQVEPGASLRECVEQAVATTREEQRSEQDLSAQRQMAQWAFWLLIATIAQMPLTALGLILLLWTIRQGREALDLQKSGNRPWLTFRNLKVHRINMIRPTEAHEGEDWIIAAVIEVEIVNSGSTPAKDIRVIAHVIEDPLSTESEAEVEFWAKGQIEINRGFPLGILPPEGTGLYKYAVPRCVPYYVEGGAERRDIFPGVALAMIYRGMDDEVRRQTVQVFRLSNADPKLHTDTPQANGFWLTHTSYADHAITIIAGNKLDRAT
jgi:hypothetical protein